jgi:hypothetical protein
VATAGSESGSPIVEAGGTTTVPVPREGLADHLVVDAPLTATEIARSRAEQRLSDPDLDPRLEFRVPEDEEILGGELAEAQRNPRRGFWITMAVLGALMAAESITTFALAGHQVSREDRLVWQQTSLVLPASLLGVQRQQDPASTAQSAEQASNLLSDSAGNLSAQIGHYVGTVNQGPDGLGEPTVRKITVVAGRPKAPLTPADRSVIRSTYTSAMSKLGLTLASRDPGTLGGWMGCGALGPEQTLCLAVDAGSVITITLNGTGRTVEDQAVNVRDAVEVAQ